MRIALLAVPALLATALIADSARAGELPSSSAARQTSYNYNYNYYGQETQPSPSDMPAAPHSSGPSCDVGCDVGCDGGCDGGSCSRCGCANGTCGCGCGREPWTLFPRNECGLNVGGWLQAGYHDQPNGLFNNHPDMINLHQAWVWAEKVADGGDCCWDWGFRVDAMYGVDAQDTQAFGNNPGVWDFQNGLDHGIYGWAMPQLYAELAKGPLSVKVGHFYTIQGYEVVQAPGNFFYSHAYTFYNSEPFTHTGALATYSYSDNLDLYGGWTLGWDTGFDQFNDGSNFLGGFGYTFWGDWRLIYTTTFGDFGKRGDDAYAHSVVLQVPVTDRLEYVLLSDYLDTSTVGDYSYSAVNYLFYTLNDCWKVGGRVEWWKAGGISTYEATGGLNWSPHPNLVVRPEVRQDWSPALNFDETIFGVDAYVTF